MIWRDHLQTCLLEMQPTRVCALDESARHLALGVLQAIPVNMPDNLSDSPSALALGVDALNGLNAEQAQNLISRTRLYIAPRIMLAAQAGCALDEEGFRALGFTLSLTDAAENMRIYYYDLDTYKTVPDWLNARYWAHPERWEP
jgi:hypothetical protein